MGMYVLQEKDEDDDEIAQIWTIPRGNRGYVLEFFTHKIYFIITLNLYIILPLEMTESIRFVFSISSTGFADRIRISACLPGSMVPV
jgi:hypothetical protein